MALAPELLPIDGLEIEHEVIDIALVRQAEQECRMLFSAPAKTIRLRDQSEGDAGQITGYDLNSDDAIDLGLPAVYRILESIGRAKGYAVTINHQTPHSIGAFHVDDNVAEPTKIIQLSDDGFFDSAPNGSTEEDAREKATPVPVSAGDALTLQDNDLVHRGRNPSEHDRYNLVVAKLAPNLSIEDAIRESAEQDW